MKSAKYWLTWAIAVIGGFFSYELYAIFDGNPDTSTLTYNIITHIPADLFFVALGGLMSWVFYHFFKYYGKVGQ